MPCDLTLGPVEVKLYRSSMYLKRLYFLIFIFSYTSVFSQFEKWPEQPKRIIWLAANNASFGDGATNESPIDVSNAEKLDKVLSKLSLELGVYGEGLVLRFLSGSYETYGIKLRPRWHLIGDGIDKTSLKLVPSIKHRKIKSAYHSVIGGGWGPQFTTELDRIPLLKRDFNNIRIADISLNCNWEGMKENLGPIVKKVSGIDLLAKQALVERVKVKNFGAVGGRPSWREVFPIRVISGMGDGANLPGYKSSIIEIRHCVVDGAVLGPDIGTEWPYCTGIMVSHIGADIKNFTVSALVHHNEIINVINGIAFGGAFLQKAVFFDNKVTNCGIGFNFDTGSNSGVIIRNNKFSECIGGGSVNNGKHFEIRKNTFSLKPPDRSRYSYWHNGLRLWDHTRGFIVRDNRFEFSGKSKALSRGIILHGVSVGLTMFQDGFGVWKSKIDPHQFFNNNYFGFLPNTAGPQEANQNMHLKVGDLSLHLTGIDGVGDGIQFYWSDD